MSQERYVAPAIPIPPPPVIEAAAQGKLAIFVGAGLSMLVGSPSWDDFANGALSQLRDKHVLSEAEIEQLRGNMATARIRVSIAKDTAASVPVPIDFARILEPGSPALAPFEDLIRMGRTFVTTNYDRWIEKAGDPILRVDAVKPASTKGRPTIPDPDKFRRIYRAGEISHADLYTPNCVVHLHGSLDDPDGMIVSTRDYLAHYIRPNIVEFLRYLFEEFVVLFVGYGVQESEVLEHVFRKQPITKAALEVGKHYWLFPVFSFQENVLRHLKNYYRRNCNVELVEFSRDVNNYKQLANVIRDWSNVVKFQAPGFIDAASVIDDAFNV